MLSLKSLIENAQLGFAEVKITTQRIPYAQCYRSFMKNEAGTDLFAANTVGKFLKDRGNTVTNVLQKHSPCWRQTSELQVNASLKTYVTVFAAADWCPWPQAPPPACCFGWNAPERHCCLPPRWGFVSIFLRCFRLRTLFISWHFYSQALRSFTGWTWRSGGWRRSTPAGRRPDPRVRTFISPRQSQTAAGPPTSRAAAPKFTATELWLIPAGLCPETLRR